MEILHYYYKYDTRFDYLINGPIANIGDFRTSRGVVVAPGCINRKTGFTYSVIDGYDDNIPQLANMPDWLFSIISRDRRRN